MNGTSDPVRFAARHVEAFNQAVLARDFGDFLAGFADDAVMRFENVPGAGVLVYDGRAAYTAAYADQPPDDQIDVVGPVSQVGPETVIPFTWRRDGARGTIRLVTSGGMIAAMTVRFG